MSYYIRHNDDGSVIVSDKLNHHILSIREVFQAVDFVIMLRHLITTDPDRFQQDPIGCIAQMNEQYIKDTYEL